jgi:putative NADH-flavin reductase
MDRHPIDGRPPADPAAEEDAPARTIALFGATGRTGAWIGLRALRRGYGVQALRRPSSLDPLEDKPVAMRQGDVQNPDDVDPVVEGSDAVLVALGQRRPYTDVFCEAATTAILEAMRIHDVWRIIAVTGAQIGDMDQGQTPIMRRLARRFALRQPAVAADRSGQERALMDSDREWTIVKPPRLTDAPRRGRVKSGTQLRIGLLSRIGRADLADFMLDQIESTEYLRERVLVRA